MTESRMSMVVWSGDGTTISLAELARESRCHPGIVETFARLGVIETVSSTESAMRFSPSAIPRLRRALRLRRDLSVSGNALGLVLDLLDRIDELESELKKLRG